MSTEEVKLLLKELSQLECLGITFTGGEPLVREDFSEIYIAAKELGFIVNVFTNATLATDSIKKLFQRYPPNDVAVTMYGLTAEVYEEFTNVTGSFEAFMLGLQKLREANAPTRLRTMVSTINYHQVSQMKAWAMENGYGELQIDPFIFQAENKSDAPLKYRVPPQEVVRLEFSDEDRVARIIRRLELAYKAGLRPVKTWCKTGGTCAACIDPMGRVSPCTVIREPHVGIRDRGSFSSVWLGEVADFRKEVMDKYPNHEPCKSCRIHVLCNNCPGLALRDSGAFDRPSNYCCEVAHLRLEYLAKVVPWLVRELLKNTERR